MELTKSDLLKIEKKVEPILKDVGKYILNNWYKTHDLSYKDKRDLATEVDVKAEEILRDKLGSVIPSAGFVVEEGHSVRKEGYNWVIDSLDGTKYFVKHVPMFFTQIALVKDNQPILGQIYNPSSDQIFSASLSNGAKVNNIRMTPKLETLPDKAIIDIDYGGSERGDIEWKSLVIKDFLKRFYRVKLASGFMAIYLVTGGIDAHVVLNESIKVGDILPRRIIFDEAGLETRYITIRNTNIYIASNKELLDLIIGMMNRLQ